MKKILQTIPKTCQNGFLYRSNSSTIVGVQEVSSLPNVYFNFGNQLSNTFQRNATTLESIPLDKSKNVEMYKYSAEYDIQSLNEKTKIISSVFPSIDFSKGDYSVVTFAQSTQFDMRYFCEGLVNERKNLANCSAKKICGQLEKLGYWADFIDPSTAYPQKSEQGKPLIETNSFNNHPEEKWKVEKFKCCYVINHREWGYNSYLSSIFTNAPGKIVCELLS